MVLHVVHLYLSNLLYLSLLLLLWLLKGFASICLLCHIKKILCIYYILHNHQISKRILLDMTVFSNNFAYDEYNINILHNKRVFLQT